MLAQHHTVNKTVESAFLKSISIWKNAGIWEDKAFYVVFHFNFFQSSTLERGVCELVQVSSYLHIFRPSLKIWLYGLANNCQAFFGSIFEIEVALKLLPTHNTNR